VVVVRPRRGRCALCLVTTVLLPTVAFFRRLDLAEVIGGALHARFVAGKTRAEVVAGAGVHPDTARGWLRRFVARAEEIRVLFSSWAHRFDASLGPIGARGSPAADAMEAIGVAAAAGGGWARPRCGRSWPGSQAGCCCPTRVARSERRADAVMV
jgi:hypothetical protein